MGHQRMAHGKSPSYLGPNHSSKRTTYHRRLTPALGIMPIISASSKVNTVTTVVGGLTYPFLLLVVFGKSFSPFNPESSWGLAAEHGELQLEHLSHFIAAISAALPLAIACNFATPRVARAVLLTSSLSAALPYLAQRAHPFEANDSWLSSYTWQVAAVEVAVAPLLLATVLACFNWLWRRRG